MHLTWFVLTSQIGIGCKWFQILLIECFVFYMECEWCQYWFPISLQSVEWHFVNKYQHTYIGPHRLGRVYEHWKKSH